jgi:hypothetical protein
LAFTLGRQVTQIEVIDALHDAIELFLETAVGADIKVAFEQCIKGAVEILFGGVSLACLVGV